MKRYQKDFDDVTNKMNEMESHYLEKLHIIEESGDDLLNQWEHFHDGKILQQNHLLYLFDHKEFLFPQEMKYYLQNFQSDGLNCKADLHKMKTKARKRLHIRGMYNIMKCRWLLNAISKLRGLHKSVPVACFRFLVVLKNIVMLGWKITKEIYYYVMERCVKNPHEEHADVLVYKTLKVARDALDISPEEFLNYLEEHSYAASPELLANIRAIKHKRDRDSKLAEAKKKKMAALIAKNISSSRPGTTGSRGGVGTPIGGGRNSMSRQTNSSVGSGGLLNEEDVDEIGFIGGDRVTQEGDIDDDEEDDNNGINNNITTEIAAADGDINVKSSSVIGITSLDEFPTVEEEETQEEDSQ